MEIFVGKYKMIYTFYLKHQKYPSCALIFLPIFETESILLYQILEKNLCLFLFIDFLMCLRTLATYWIPFEFTQTQRAVLQTPC